MFPPEILAHIFKIGTQRRDPDNHRPVQPNLPWRASKVSQFWRSVALSTPSLWTNIVIEPTHIQPAVFQGNISALKLQLDRSQKCPLSLVVELLGPITGSSLDKLRDALLPHLHRVRLLMTLRGSWSRIFPASNSSLPPSSIFPSLREIDFTRVSEEHLASIPFEQLTYVSLAMMEYNDILYIIERSKGTVETLRIREALRFHWLPSSESPPRWERGLVLPRLKVLTLDHVGEFLMPRETSNDDERGWFQSAPMLEEITVLDPEGDVALDLVTTFIQRSSCPLTSFATLYHDPSYVEGRASEFSLESFLRTVPTLTSLDMHLYDLSTLNSILKLLARSQTSDTSPGQSLPAPELCPSLRSIRLGNDEEDDVFDLDEFDLASLVDMIELRRVGGLEKVEIRNVIEMGEEVFDEDREAAKMLMETYKIVFI